MQGILEYVSPEMLLCGAYNAGPPRPADAPLTYSTAADVWALGVTVYTCLVGRVPFQAEENEALFHQILFREPEYPPDLDRAARAFIAQCMRKRPADRPPIDDLLTDPFISDNLGWDSKRAGCVPDQLFQARESAPAGTVRAVAKACEMLCVRAGGAV